MDNLGTRYVGEDGRLKDINGNNQNMFDFIATKPFVKRYYDYNTKNTSFLNLYVFLKKMGVNNCNEHLQLFHPELVGVDPHSKALPNNVKLLILQELKMNPWYYFREVLRINAGAGTVRSRIGLESFTSIFFALRRRNILLTAPRQVGKTVSLLSLLSWILNFAGQNTNMGNIHYRAERATENLNAIEKMLDNLPEYLKFYKKTLGKTDKDGSKQSKDKAKSSSKKTSLTCDLWGNNITNFVVGQDPVSANNCGRGKTLPIWLFDEIAHTKYNQIALNAFSPAYTEARNVARRNGDLFGLWTICTPGDLKTDEGSWVWHEINNEYFRFSSEHFKMFDMTEEEIVDYIGNYSRKGTIFISWRAEELGYSNTWIKEKSETLDTNGIRSEVLLKWETHTTSSPFPPYLITQLEAYALDRRKMMKELVLDDFGNTITYYPRPHHRGKDDFHSFLMNFWDGIVIGVDVAYGVGGNADSTTMVGIDARTLEVVFTYKNNGIIVDDFAVFLIQFIDEFFIGNNIKVAVAIERNSNGLSLIGILKKYTDYNKFFVVYPAKESKLFTARPVDITFNYKGVKNMNFDIGLTVSKNRGELVNLMVQAVHKYTECMAVPEIVEEIKTLVTKKTLSGEDKIEAADGKHDDIIFGLIHALYAIFRNADLLEKRNGIKINPVHFKINKNTISINSTGRINKRIVTSYKMKNGKIEAEYFDSLQGIVVSKETAERLVEEDRAKMLISSEGITPSISSPIITEEEVKVREMLKDSGSSGNIQVWDTGTSATSEYISESSYDTWLSNLFGK